MTARIRAVEFAQSVEFDLDEATPKTIAALGVVTFHAHTTRRAIQLPVIVVLHDPDHPLENVMSDISMKVEVRDPLDNVMFLADVASTGSNRTDDGEPFSTTFAFTLEVPAGVDGRYVFRLELYEGPAHADTASRPFWVIGTDRYDPPSPLNARLSV